MEPDRWERMVSAINARASVELARRAESRSALVLVAGWNRPMLTVAAALTLLSAATLYMLETLEDRPFAAAQAPGMLEALQVPTPAALWLAEGRAPSLEDLALALEGDNP